MNLALLCSVVKMGTDCTPVCVIIVLPAMSIQHDVPSILLRANGGQYSDYIVIP